MMTTLTQRWTHVHGRTRRDGGPDERLIEYLAIWLGLYFNGTPRPIMWQEIADLVDREGGATNMAFTMKQYGDVYRIERRRWVERSQRGVRIDDQLDFAGLSEIVTVVDHPILLVENEERPLSTCDAGTLATLANWSDEPMAGEWLSSASLSDVARRTAPEYADALLSCVTERLARLYCALQVFAYSNLNYPLKAIWRITEGPVRTLRNSVGGDRQLVVKVRAGHNPDVDRLPSCVLSTREGIVRDFGQVLSSPSGRGAFSRRQSQLRESIEREIDVLVKALPRGVDGVAVVGRVS